MPNIYTYDNEQTRHSDDMQDIITMVPSWLLRWGITLFFGILVLIIGLSAMISYPDIMKAQLKIDASNQPEPVITKTPGKLVKLLATQNEIVKAGQPLAWIESTTDHSKSILIAPQAGRVSFAGIIQENQALGISQEVFYIIPDNEEFYGEMVIPQDNMGKIKEGQQVLIKLKAYPFEEYGMIRGKISYITEVPFKGSFFMAKVDFNVKKTADLKKPIHLRQGMTADAEIITQDETFLQRLSSSFKIF